jgi:hypothetical protein
MKIATRQELLSQGWTPWMIRRELGRGNLHTDISGWYRSDNAWFTVVDLLLKRGGPGSVISHRAAAFLHGFDLFEQEPDPEITAPFTSTLHDRRVHRTRNIDELDVVHHGPRPVTSRARTLLDLSSSLTRNELEIAVESALRSDHPTNPALWCEDVLERLVRLSSAHRAGVANLRAVLNARPPGCRPTGSAFETRAVQALRPLGLGGLHRQPSLSIIDGSTGQTIGVYPDLACLTTGTAIELDGEKYHRDRRQAERRRDNIVSGVVRILRYDSSTPLPKMAYEVRAIIEARGRTPWPDPRWKVSRTDHSVIVRIPANSR